MGKITVYEMEPVSIEFAQMKSIWDGCIALNISPPPQVVDYFGGKPPCIKKKSFVMQEYRDDWEHFETWEVEGQAGAQIDLSRLKESTRALRIIFDF